MSWALGSMIVVCIALRIPLAFSILLSCMVVIGWGLGPQALGIVPQRLFAGMDSFLLLAIPFFLLAGNLMTAGGLSERLFRFANTLVGRFRGGLAISNVLTSVFFGGISGSAVADTSAIGRLFIPAMVERGYSAPFAVAVTAASSPIAPIIPPSIGFIVYGYITEQSITKLFAAGVVPGLLFGIALMILTYGIAVRNRFPVESPATGTEIVRAFWSASLALFMPVFILIGILGGVFTVTECSAIAVVYALVVGGLVYRQLTWVKFLDSLTNAARTTAVIMVIVAAARLFSWVLAYYQVPELFSSWMEANITSAAMFLLAVNVFLLLVGTFMENNAAKLMLLPLLFPVSQGLGVDPIHFGVVVTVNMTLGLITPPVGLCLALACRIGNISIERGTIAVWPFFLTGLVVLVIVTMVPALSTSLPALMFD